MIRGTTPLHTFTLPIDVELIKKVRIIYSQNDKPVLTKETEDCILNDKQVQVKLTQEDTFKLNHNNHVDIQIRVLTNTDDAIASLPQRVGVDRCLENEVL